VKLRDQAAQAASARSVAELRPLLDVAAISVVSAMRDPTNLYIRPLAYVTDLGFSGRIYPANPNQDEFGGLRCYVRLTDIPNSVAAREAGITIPTGYRGAVASTSSASS
jgi:predicted CoA-binding protein